MDGYSDFPDSLLVERLRSDDRAAFAEIYRRYKGPLYVHAFHRLQDREETKDLLQQLFATLWENRKHLNIDGYLSGYLFTAVRNRVLKFVARQNVNSRYIASVQSTINNTSYQSDQLVREKELSAIIEKEISALPTKMREIFELSRKQHLSNAEIAEILDISEKTVRNQLNNALSILRSKLGLFGVLFVMLYQHKF
ncbi:RNA polymerase sigma factor [Mucilaginibacter sp. SG564]|uniref:RNA polymerase sigma factor n=1 Tax=Mucilaginibacter sp. SG564 TaxID=2587022 RepID=UPI001551FBC0|nr:RNA polymerase sigma-70 factor [Mucilaginibacter sp. SG564]NOW96058.1 RNA polymerase sigma-70 factor (ECF subfamily) [Mucilaginibacter sp. SG564]